MRRFVFVLAAVLILAIASPVNVQGQTIGYCKNLSTPNTVYTLNQSVSSPGTCFNITAHNITLDCQGYSINASQTTIGYGVNNTEGYDNITIRNCYFKPEDHFYSDSIRFSNSLNPAIINNTFMQRSSYGYVIRLENGCHNANISNNNLTQLDVVSAIYIFNSDNVTIQDNNISITGVWWAVLPNNHVTAITLYDSKNATFVNNNITSNWWQSVNVIGSETDHFDHTIGEDNTINNMPVKYIAMISDTKYEDLDWSSYEVLVFNSTNLTFSNLTLDHILFGDRVKNSMLENSTIKSTALVGLQICTYAWPTTINNFEVRNNLINHTVNSYPVFLSRINNVNFTNNTILNTGTEITLRQTSNAGCNLYNNTINSTNAPGISSYPETFNVIYEGNVIETAGANDHYGIYIVTWGGLNRLYMKNNRIKSSGPAIKSEMYVSASNGNLLINDSILNSTDSYDIQIVTNTNGTMNLTNVTLAHNNISWPASTTMKINIRWYLDVSVTDSSDDPVQGANITITNAYNELVYSGSTGANGLIPTRVLLEYWQNATQTKYYTNYTINVSKAGYNNDSAETNLTTNKIVYLTFQSQSHMSCEITSSCSYTEVFYLKNETGGYRNAHAQLVTNGSYPYVVCCDISAGTLSNSSCADVTVLKLSDTTNAHAQVGNYTGPGQVYTESACLSETSLEGSIQCIYTNSDCSANYECLVSIASSESSAGNLTNAHVGPCGEYLKNVCCRYYDSSIPIITIYSPQNTTYYTQPIDLNVSASEAIDTWRYSLNGGSNITFNPNTTITPVSGLNNITVYANDSVGNVGSSTVWFTYSGMDISITKMISPDLVVAWESENVTVNIMVKVNQTSNNIPVINVSDEVPYDFPLPYQSSIRVYFIDYSPYQVIEITTNATVNITVLDRSGSLSTLVMVNISDITQTDASSNLTEDDALMITYIMTTDAMDDDEQKTMYTYALVEDNQSNVFDRREPSYLYASEVVLRGYKTIWVQNLSNPQNLTGKIILKSIGGTVSELYVSDYFPSGATIWDFNITYYNYTSDTTIQLVNSTDYSVSGPYPDVLPDGTNVDIYIYNLTVDTGGGSSNWANSSFDRCMNITIDNAGSSTLTNFPAYINLTYDNDMQPNFKDIRFYNENCGEGGSEVDYEIENYTTSDRADIWVRISSLPSTGTNISIYYKNNTAVGSGENPTGVWDSNYVGVWHMTEINATDSTSNNNQGNQSGGVTFNSSGKIDGADSFDGNDDYINVGSEISLNDSVPFSIVAWVNVASFPPTVHQALASFLVDGSANGFAISINDVSSYNPVTFGSTNAAVFDTFRPTEDFTSEFLGKWNHLVITYNGGGGTSASNFHLYFNGDDKPLTTSNIFTGLDNANHIGHFGGTSRFFNGTIDEVRISNTTRTADWINQSYLIVANQSDYVSFGSEGNRPTGGVANWDGNLYDNDTLTIMYNMSVLGGGQWFLPAIIAGWDPQYQKHIKTEMYGSANVPSFDVSLKTLTAKVQPGEVVKGLLRLMNVGGPQAKVDVFVTYSAKTMEGDLIVERSETFAVVEEKEQELALPLPESLKEGMYTFEAFVTYTGREALSTDIFEVIGTGGAAWTGDASILYYILVAVMGIIIGVLIVMKRK